MAGQAQMILKLPSIAARGKSPLTENVFLVWADVNLDSPGCATTCGTGTQADVDIYFARLKSSTMNGTISVEPGFPKVMDLDPTVDYLCADQFFPWMTIDGYGTLHLVYFDNRHTPDALDITEGPNSCPSSSAYQRDDDSCSMTFDLYYTFSSDDGDTWSAPERITTAAEGGSSLIRHNSIKYFIGDYIGVSASLNTALPTVVNAAFNRDLNDTGRFKLQEVYAGKIDPATCSSP